MIFVVFKPRYERLFNNYIFIKCTNFMSIHNLYQNATNSIYEYLGKI